MFEPQEPRSAFLSTGGEDGGTDGDAVRAGRSALSGKALVTSSKLLRTDNREKKEPKVCRSVFVFWVAG